MKRCHHSVFDVCASRCSFQLRVHQHNHYRPAQSAYYVAITADASYHVKSGSSVLRYTQECNNGELGHPLMYCRRLQSNGIFLPAAQQSEYPLRDICSIHTYAEATALKWSGVNACYAIDARFVICLTCYSCNFADTG
jgi:hypothetical protein